MTGRNATGAVIVQRAATGLAAGGPPSQRRSGTGLPTTAAQNLRPHHPAAVTGLTPDGQEVAGTYADGRPIADGLPENVEFFELTDEDPDLVSLGRKFQAVAPLLWLKAGGRGCRIEQPTPTWALTDNAHYGVLFDTDQWRGFVDEVATRKDLTHAYIVTDSDATLQQIVSELPSYLGFTQLYEEYLRTFQINTKGRS